MKVSNILPQSCSRSADAPISPWDTTSVLGYVHWTFPDQSVEDQYPSYIMARSLDDVIIGHTRSSFSSSPIQVQVSFLLVDIFEVIKIYLPHVECLVDPFCFVV